MMRLLTIFSLFASVGAYATDPCGRGYENLRPSGIEESEWTKLQELIGRYRALSENAQGATRDERILLSARIQRQAAAHLLEFDRIAFTLRPQSFPEELARAGISRSQLKEVQDMVNALKTATGNDRILMRARLNRFAQNNQMEINAVTGALTPLPVNFDIALSGLPRAEL